MNFIPKRLLPSTRKRRREWAAGMAHKGVPLVRHGCPKCRRRNESTRPRTVPRVLTRTCMHCGHIYMLDFQVSGKVKVKDFEPLNED